MVSSIDRLARDLADLKENVRDLSGTPQLAHSAIVDGAVEQVETYDTGEIDEFGNPVYGTRLVARFGQQPDGTNTVNTIVGPTPPRPVGHVVTAGPGFIAVEWFGLFEDRIEPYLDHDYIAVHVGTDALYTPIADTLKATMRSSSGEKVTIALDEGTYFVKLVAVSTVPNYSLPSGHEQAAPGTASSIDVTARQMAQEALDTANEAITFTAGLNSVTYSTSFPAGTLVYSGTEVIGITVPAGHSLHNGDTHFVNSGGASPYSLVFRFNSTASEWQRVRLEDAVLHSVSAAKILTGELSASTVITLGNPTSDHIRLGHVPEEVDDGFGNTTTVTGPALQVMRPTGDGGLAPGIQIGGVADRLQIIDPTGAALAGFDEYGNGTAQTFATPYMELNGDSLEELLWKLPRGVVAGFQATSTLAVNRPVVPAGPFAPLYEVAGYLQGGRIYRLSAEVTWYTSVAARAVLGFEITTDGTAPAGTSINAINPHGHYYATEANRIQRGHLSTYFLTSYSRDVWTDVRAVLTAAVSTGNFYVQQANAQDTTIRTYPYVVIEDCGPILDSGFMNQGTYRRTTGGTVTPPTGTTTKTITLAATWDQVFRGGSVYGTTDLIQGASSWGNHRSMIGFNWNGLPAGSSVIKAEAYVYMWHWNLGAGGRMDFGIHSASSAPATYSGSGSYVYPGASYWSKGKGIWVTLPSAWNAQFTSGNAKGFVIGASGSTNGVYYGKGYGVSSAVAAAYKPQLRLTYTTS